MRLSFFIASGLASFLSVAGLPTVPSTPESSIKQIRNPLYKRDGVAALINLHQKYNIDLPESLANSALARRDDTGTATNRPIEDGAEWLTPVQIGNPPTTFQMDLDTGSSDLWVYGSKAAAASGSRTRYNSSESNSCQEMKGAKWFIEYGDGSSASGHVVTDTVSIGGLSVKSQAVQVADKVHESFARQKNVDGLLGLGFSSINTITPKKQKTFFDHAKTEHSAGVFTADLQHDAPGTYSFGFINKTTYMGDIAYTPVDPSNGMWTFTSTGFAAGTDKVNKTSITAIADTGTSLIWLPELVNKAYYAQVEGAKVDETAGGWVFPCDAKLPDFTFNIGDKGITVPGSYMNYASVEGPQGPEGTENKRAAAGSGSCFGGLQSSEGTDLNILGDIALKAAFVVFDAEKTRIGFAEKMLSGI
ncbi:putative endothiapepsin precursor [Fusarium heterosporum]|uniref:Putative endothiapepsin n=1 Tax=Fusarium heterosporum TaxID=42747 RepID=A0A8H5T7G2_FUSHE|nr:putative endothiapepsin precursor [Fusarium heterosporum]